MALADDLPPDLLPALRARVLDERPYDEIARDLQTTESAVRQRVSRALRRAAPRVWRNSDERLPRRAPRPGWSTPRAGSSQRRSARGPTLARCGRPWRWCSWSDRRRWRRPGSGAPRSGSALKAAPHATADAPPADQLKLLSVLRRPQTDADRGPRALQTLQGLSDQVEGVRTGSVRLLAQGTDRVVLVPVARFNLVGPEPGADLPQSVKDRLAPQRDGLCLWALDSDSASEDCYTTAEVRAGRAHSYFNGRAAWLVPDGVAAVRVRYAGGVTREAPVHGNFAVYGAPSSYWQQATLLDAAGRTVKTAAGQPAPPDPRDVSAVESDPVPPGSSHSGIVARIAISGTGRTARYELKVSPPPKADLRVVFMRPSCTGETTLLLPLGKLIGPAIRLDVHPSLGDPKLAEWCPGRYRGEFRDAAAGDRVIGRFDFRVPR